MSVLSEVTTLAPVNDRLLTPKEAAEVLGVGRGFVYALTTSGELPSKKFGSARRIWFSDLRRWVDAH